MLRFAASLEQASHHVVAAAIVSAAVGKGLKLQIPQNVRETMGSGLGGVVDARKVCVGSHQLVYGGGRRCAAMDHTTLSMFSRMLLSLPLVPMRDFRFDRLGRSPSCFFGLIFVFPGLDASVGAFSGTVLRSLVVVLRLFIGSPSGVPPSPRQHKGPMN